MLLSPLGFSLAVPSRARLHPSGAFPHGLWGWSRLPAEYWVFSPAESDGQLCGVAPAQDEEPPACPDEFDDFVTFEASGSH